MGAKPEVTEDIAVIKTEIKYISEKIDTLSGNMRNLTEHVNEEHERYSERLKILEDLYLGQLNRYEGRMELLKWGSIFTSVIVFIITVYTFLCNICF